MLKRVWIAISLAVLTSLAAGALGQEAPRERADLIISGGLVVTMDERFSVIEDGAVAVRGERIIAVGPREQIERQYQAPTVIEARGQAIIPGLINAHTHVPMTLFRGLADDLDLDEWLTKYIFPAEAKNVSESFVRAGTRLGLAEMIRSGTTTFCDMYYFEDAIAEETAKAGMRAVLGETLIDFPAPDNKTFAGALRYAESFIRRWHGHALIVPAIAPHAPYTVSEEHLRAARALADRLKAPLIIHVAETRKELEEIRRQKGATPVQYLARIGFLKNDVIAAHLVYVDDDDIALLQKFAVGVAHNPQSNMKLASGIAPVPKMLAAKLAVGLGTDGAASNNDLNLWEEMDTAAKLHKVATLDPRVVSAREALWMATMGGARALGLAREVGSLEVGKRADLAIVALDGLHQTPRYDIYSQLVYATKAADVRTVIVNGRIVMRDRRLLTLDEAEIKREAEAWRARIERSVRNGAAKGAPRG
ncbi:amidohydrolase [Pyrinomonas methylaliphatogenes]|uniref:5-methylthioadenosine/S-adenosylhomocysteine deaminase n=1 Tax=Pyrinomonas methylaliphatogenes TaxID=454194 RepID=A0A0B6WW66_9BACT|nr:amidohydrolase [Pyrinomonas methylaliphatogenes]CDM65508.1 cytosine deaminase-like metal-dependent hydrolase [Pyrinomonas methylaliphatogenes]